MREEITRLFSEARWDEIAAKIDTRTENPETSRALVVFNPVDNARSGIAVFHVDMPWQEGRELPAIQVSHLESKRLCASSVSDPQFTASVNPEIRGRIVFDIYFEAENVPAKGWDTYIAEYKDTHSERFNLEYPADNFTSQLIVVETLRHNGIFGNIGRLFDLDS